MIAYMLLHLEQCEAACRIIKPIDGCISHTNSYIIFR
jgi:hypothetical protein